MMTLFLLMLVKHIFYRSRTRHFESRTNEGAKSWRKTWYLCLHHDTEDSTSFSSWKVNL